MRSWLRSNAIIGAGFIPMDRCAILVCDECHHVKGGHPFNKVMRDYFFTCNKVDGHRPQFLGMTASPGKLSFKTTSNQNQTNHAPSSEEVNSYLTSKQHGLEVKKRADSRSRAAKIVESLPRTPGAGVLVYPDLYGGSCTCLYCITLIPCMSLSSMQVIITVIYIVCIIVTPIHTTS